MGLDDDWRIRGQARHLQGLTWHWQKWASEDPSEDHDHCDFCMIHFGDQVFGDDPDTQLEGWTTPDLGHWVCGPCFSDFKERFDFHVEEPNT